MRNLLFLLFVIFCLFSCKKDEVEINYVPDYLKSMIPYSDGSTMKFESNKGDVINATAKKVVNIYEYKRCNDCDIYLREESIANKVLNNKNVNYPQFFELEIF